MVIIQNSVKEHIKMRIIIDTELNKIIVPNSFFNQIDKMNKLLEERGAGEKKIDYTQYVKDAYEKAISSPIVRQSDIKR